MLEGRTPPCGVTIEPTIRMRSAPETVCCQLIEEALAAVAEEEASKPMVAERGTAIPQINNTKQTARHRARIICLQQ
jgi:hypothetical protein